MGSGFQRIRRSLPGCLRHARSRRRGSPATQRMGHKSVFANLVGKRFGSLTGLSLANKADGHSTWLCRSDCGPANHRHERQPPLRRHTAAIVGRELTIQRNRARARLAALNLKRPPSAPQGCRRRELGVGTAPPAALPGHRSIDNVFRCVADVFADMLSCVAGAQQQGRREHCDG